MNIASTQKGVALITALMIVALATIVSANIVTKLQIDVRRTANIIASDQAKLYALAAEDLAKRYLLDDVQDNQYDHLGENWALQYIFPIEDGTLTAQLTDMQSCININTLVRGQVNNNTRDRIGRVLNNADLSAGLIQPIIDWVDTDVQPQIPDGAEDAYYTALENPYRAANTQLHSISELRLLRGFEKQETLDAVANSLCAYGDQNTASPININTAPLEVLLSLSSTMDTSTANDIIEYRVDDPFTTTTEFRNFGNVATIIQPLQDISVSTNYFMLETNIVIGDARVTMFSLLNRGSVVSIITRSQGVY